MSFQKYFNKNLRNFIIILLLIFSSIGYSKTLTIFYTTDIHGVLNSESGGIFRLSTELKKQVSVAGGYQNCLLIDCGDFSQGSIEAAISKGEIDYRLLKLMNYNILVLGNHEFDYGFESLDKNIGLLEESPEILCGNLLVNDKPSSFKSWDIFYKSGFKIAVIGLTYPNTKSSESSTVKYESTDPYLALKRIIPDVVKVHPDIVILAIHGGVYNKDWSLKYLAKKFPEIDLILAGHTHVEEEKEFFNRTYVFQAGKFCDKLGKIEISDDVNGGKKLVLTELIPLANVDVDSDLIQSVKPLLAKINEKAKTTIASFSSKRDIKKLLPKIINEYAKTDITLLGVAPDKEIYLKNITYSDVFKLIPHEDNVATLLVSKDELLKILQELYKYDKKKKKYNGFFYYGFSIDKGKNGYPTGITFDNNLESKIKLGKISMAMSSYYMEYPTNKFPDIRKIAEQGSAKYKNLGVSIRDVFINLLSQKQ